MQPTALSVHSATWAPWPGHTVYALRVSDQHHLCAYTPVLHSATAAAAVGRRRKLPAAVERPARPCFTTQCRPNAIFSRL